MLLARALNYYFQKRSDPHRDPWLSQLTWRDYADVTTLTLGQAVPYNTKIVHKRWLDVPLHRDFFFATPAYNNNICYWDRNGRGPQLSA
jgi:hypothetical protein